jgi:hypothetical protein
MSDARFFRFVHDDARHRAAEFCLQAPAGWVAKISEPTRSLDQNAAQWPILQAFADQLEWPVNGQMTRLRPEEWKDILTAAFRQEAPRVAQGLDGGMVLLGHRTREFGKREFSDWLEFLHATAVAREVTVYAEDAA